jgi:CIC family chloride channel protein
MVVFLVKNFAPEAKGHGVPEVIEAVYYHKGVIRPVVSVVRALASALSIGSGGSVGRDVQGIIGRRDILNVLADDMEVFGV